MTIGCANFNSSGIHARLIKRAPERLKIPAKTGLATDKVKTETHQS